ncbi:unnamed protein product [Lampetra planeri]
MWNSSARQEWAARSPFPDGGELPERPDSMLFARWRFFVSLRGCQPRGSCFVVLFLRRPAGVSGVQRPPPTPLQ